MPAGGKPYGNSKPKKPKRPKKPKGGKRRK